MNNEKEKEKEKLLKSHPDPISYECTKTILEQMKKNICKLKISDGGRGTGFFCKIPFPDKEHLLPVLITNNHVINEIILKKENETIELEFECDKKSKYLNNLGERKKYTNKIIDVTFIEIKDIDEINDFLELDENLSEIGLGNKYNKTSIYIPQYPEEKLSVSYGIINSLIDNDFTHLCSTKKGSSGSPVLNISNNKIIGVHKEFSPFEYNVGLFLDKPIKLFFEHYNESLIKEFNKKYKLNIKNDLVEKLDLSKKSIGKEIKKYFDNIKFKNLKELDLWDNNIAEINFLSKTNLEQLEKLSLGNNQISDLNAFNNINFRQLKELDLWNNKITDLDFFQNITIDNIEKLNLGNNKITDINSLNKIKSDKLKELYLYWNDISNIDILGKMNLEKLEILNLSENNISDINVFEKTKIDKLKQLILNKNKIEDINILKIMNLNHLEILNLGNNKISDIKMLDHMNFPNIKELYLNSNNINDISILENVKLKKLEILNLGDNQISDINPLKKSYIPEIKELNLYKNQISDINVFKDVKFWYLKSLNISENKISDIKVLSQVCFDGLIKLFLFKNEIINIDVFEHTKFEKMEILDLSENKISNIDSLLKNQDFQHLTKIDLTKNLLDNNININNDFNNILI